MYTFGLGRPVYSFGLGLPYATQSIEIDVDFATLHLLGHALTVEVTVDTDIEKTPGSATLIFTGYLPSVATRYDLPLDYFLDQIRIEQPLDFITVTKRLDLVTVQRELDAISIQQEIDTLILQQQTDNVRVFKELDQLIIQKKLDLVRVTRDSN